MTNAESDPDYIETSSEVTATIQPALDAMEEGMAALRTVCSLIADEQIITDRASPEVSASNFRQRRALATGSPSF